MRKIKSFPQFINEEEDELEKSYSFSELSPEAKSNALDQVREDFEPDVDWDDSIIEDWTETLEGFGFDDIQISYNGFYSQGDGASFTSDRADAEKLLTYLANKEAQENSGKKTKVKEIFSRIDLNVKPTNDLEDLISDLSDIGIDDGESKVDPNDIYIKVVRTDSRHYHYNTIKSEVELDIWDDELVGHKAAEIEEGLQEIITDFAREKSKEIYRDLEKEYDYLHSDEYIQEIIEENDYEFDEDGNRF